MEVASINLTQLEQLSLPDTRNSSYKGSSLEQIGKVVIPLEAFASNTSGTLMKNLPYNVIMLLLCLHGERENMLQMMISTDDIQRYLYAFLTISENLMEGCES